jgi:hypothetical protein
MRVLVDGREMEEVPGGLDFPAIFTQIVRQCGRQQRVVIAANIDGEDRTGVDPKDLCDIDAASVELVRVLTAPLKEVSLNVLKECADSVPRLVDGFSEVARQLQAGNQTEGMRRAQESLTFWLDITAGVQSALSGLGLSFDSVSFSSRDTEGALSAKQVLDRVNALLEETQRAFEDQDNLEIGDILEYDLPPLLRYFQEALYILIEKAPLPKEP